MTRRGFCDSDVLVIRKSNSGLAFLVELVFK